MIIRGMLMPVRFSRTAKGIRTAKTMVMYLKKFL